MISTEDPRISRRLRRELHRLLRPGESIRRPKRIPLPCPEELRREYLCLIIGGMSGRKACRILAGKYGRYPDSIRRILRRMSRS